MRPSTTRRRRGKRDIFPSVARYTGLLCVVGMAVAYYLTRELNVYLLAAALSLAGGAEWADFIRDVLTGSAAFNRAAKRVERETTTRRPPPGGGKR